MLWLNKTKNWIIAHKNWLVLLVMFIVSYLLGKKSNQNYLEMANLAKGQYKKDNEAIVREQRMKETRDRRAKKKSDDVKKSLEEEKERRLRLIKETMSNPDEVFEDIGIKKK